MQVPENVQLISIANKFMETCFMNDNEEIQRYRK